MSDLTDAAERIARRAVTAYGTVQHLERRLLADQADAIAGPRESASAPRTDRPVEPSDDPEAGPPIRLSHSDTVPSQAARLGYYTTQHRRILQALQSIHAAFDHLDMLHRSITNADPDPTLFDEPRCPGWTVELQARLGGCGKHLEAYTRNDGTKGLLSLCAGCRKAKGRADRAERDDQ